MKPLTESMIQILKKLLDERSIVYYVNYELGYIAVHSHKTGLVVQIIDADTLVKDLFWLD